MSYLQAVVGSQELLAVACSDGSFRLLSKGSRVEKKVEDAHSGAVSDFFNCLFGLIIRSFALSGVIKGLL